MHLYYTYFLRYLETFNTIKSRFHMLCNVLKNAYRFYIRLKNLSIDQRQYMSSVLQFYFRYKRMFKGQSYM